MMNREQWREAVLDVPVFDTHTHMNNPGVPISAQSVWDIVHYFWFLQELIAVGYPADPMSLEEPERITRFVDAFARVRTTTWAMIVRRTFRNLYGIEIGNAASIREADAVVRSRGSDPSWPREVANRLHIKRITVNHETSADFPDLPGVGAALPLWPGYADWSQRIIDSDDQHAAGQEAAATIFRDVAGIASRGHRGMRVQTQAFDGRPSDAVTRAVARDELAPRGNDEMQVNAFLTHILLRAISEHGMFAQFFLGINRLEGTRNLMAISDPTRITNLYGLFEQYSCGFELVCGAPHLNIDVTQAARIYPHVHAGGLWWYNFRRSTYHEALLARFEAVPAEKNVILASDARCIEWCYAKTLLVKWLVADFLYDQVRHGWTCESDALWTAKQWLHDAAATRYI